MLEQNCRKREREEEEKREREKGRRRETEKATESKNPQKKASTLAIASDTHLKKKKLPQSDCSIYLSLQSVKCDVWSMWCPVIQKTISGVWCWNAALAYCFRLFWFFLLLLFQVIVKYLIVWQRLCRLFRNELCLSAIANICFVSVHFVVPRAFLPIHW